MKVLLLLIICWLYLVEAAVETFDDITELTNKNFDDFVKQQDTFVMFFAPW